MNQEEKKKKPRSFSHQESKIWHTPDLVTRDYHVVEIFTVESRQIKGVLLFNALLMPVSLFPTSLNGVQSKTFQLRD